MLHEIVTDQLGIAPAAHLGKPFTALLAAADAGKARRLLDAAERDRLIWGRRFTALAAGRPLAVIADALVVASNLVILIRRLEDHLADNPRPRSAAVRTEGHLLSRLSREVDRWRRETAQYREEVVRYRNELAGFQKAIVGSQKEVSDALKLAAQVAPLQLLSLATPAPGGQVPFTLREREVIGLLLQGLSNRSIAQRLRIEESAVKSRLRTVYEKLGVANRAQAILLLTGKPLG